MITIDNDNDNCPFPRHNLENYQFPTAELGALQEILGPRLDTIINLVVTNWNRGAARVQESFLIIKIIK